MPNAHHWHHILTKPRFSMKLGLEKGRPNAVPFNSGSFDRQCPPPRSYSPPTRTASESFRSATAHRAWPSGPRPRRRDAARPPAQTVHSARQQERRPPTARKTRSACGAGGARQSRRGPGLPGPARCRARSRTGSTGRGRTGPSRPASGRRGGKASRPRQSRPGRDRPAAAAKAAAAAAVVVAAEAAAAAGGLVGAEEAGACVA